MRGGEKGRSWEGEIRGREYLWKGSSGDENILGRRDQGKRIYFWNGRSGEGNGRPELWKEKSIEGIEGKICGKAEMYGR
jgi:hypothetical protein